MEVESVAEIAGIIPDEGIMLRDFYNIIMGFGKLSQTRQT